MDDDIRTQVTDLLAKFRKYGDRTKSKVGKAVLDGAMMIESQAKSMFLHGEHDAPHQGTPPHVQSGMYRNAITHRLENTGDEIIGIVGVALSDPPYPLYLETGTSKMPTGYPVLNPAAELMHDQVMEKITEAMNEMEGE
jgi:HK97 gp10 family phage protein